MARPVFRNPLRHTPRHSSIPKHLPDTPRHVAFLSKIKLLHGGGTIIIAGKLLGLQCHSLGSGQHSIGRSFLSENKVWSLQLILVEPSWLWESQCKFDLPLFFQRLAWSRSIPWWSSLRGQNNVFGRIKTVFNAPHFHFMVNLGFRKYSNIPLVPPKFLWSPCHGSCTSWFLEPGAPPPSKNRKTAMLPHPDTAQDNSYQGCDWRHYSLFYIFRHYPLFFFFKSKKIMLLLRNFTQFSVLYPRSSSERRKRLLKSHTMICGNPCPLSWMKIKCQMPVSVRCSV